MIYKTFQKVSNVCQLLDKRKYHDTFTVNGVTLTNNRDGTITTSGTATSSGGRNSKIIEGIVLNPGKYCFYTYDSNVSKVIPCLSKSADMSLVVSGNTTFTISKTVEVHFGVNVNAGNTYSGYFIPQLFDLTEMYGAGNEPATVEQFRQDFPEEMYDYSPHCFVKSYKTLLKVSNVCQLLDKSKYPATKTVNGVTFTNNGDGTITVNGTAEEEIYYNIQNIGINRLKFSINIHLNSNHIREIRNNILFEYVGYDKSNGQVFFHIQKGGVCENIVAKPQILDLTEMYGAGNEPTTVEQFRADFPNELYDYKPYSIVPSYKKSLVCKTKNLFDINKVFSAPTLCFDVSSLEIGKTYTFSSKKPIMVFKISNIRGGYNSVWNYPADSSVFTTFTFVMARDEHIPVTAKQYLFLWLPELYTTGDINTSGYVTDISQLNGYNLQIELGSTATEYHPYGYL